MAAEKGQCGSLSGEIEQNGKQKQKQKCLQWWHIFLETKFGGFISPRKKCILSYLIDHN